MIRLDVSRLLDSLLDVFVVSDGQPFVDFAENDVFRFVRVGRFQDERAAHDRT